MYPDTTEPRQATPTKRAGQPDTRPATAAYGNPAEHAATPSAPDSRTADPTGPAHTGPAARAENPEHAAPQRPQLHDVTVIRPLAILLLVVMHSFTMFGGNWPLPEGYTPIETYWWVAKTTYSFMLELFVFISGYLYAYQRLERGTAGQPLRSLVRSKLQRLILPSVVFGTIYLLCLTPPEALRPGDAYEVLRGTGHMWFLPMLFWCFIGCRLLARWRIPERRKIALLLLLALLSGISLPLRLDKTCYYLLFFYGGYLVRTRRATLLHRYARPRPILLLATAYVLLFVGGALAIRWLQTIPAEEYLLRKGLHAAKCALMIPYAATGTFTAWLLVNRLLRGRTPGRIFVAAGTLCFAVYIIHQFLLKALYYRTSLPARVDPHVLPFIGLAVALTGSVALAIVGRRTRIGRYLLG